MYKCFVGPSIRGSVCVSTFLCPSVDKKIIQRGGFLKTDFSINCQYLGLNAKNENDKGFFSLELKIFEKLNWFYFSHFLHLSCDADNVGSEIVI